MSKDTTTTSSASDDKTTGAQSFTTPGGTQVTEIKVGTGAEVKKGSSAVVNYTGTLLDGTKFDSSKNPGRSPFTVEPIGSAPVIKGWNEGLMGMKVGGTRRLVIPSDSAYGPSGRPPVIPPAATLVFEIDLLEVR
jgi:FKBP-type peptidyl-prolyl cis-trans isomerase